MRNLKSLLIAGVALAGLAWPAAAQWYGGAYPYNSPPPYGYGGPSYARPLPRDVIVERLEDRGFEDVGRPRFDGSVYVVEATSRRGGAVRLVVDAFDGHIIRQTPLTVARLDDDEGFDIDGYAAPRGRYNAPPPEMPNAPRWRQGEPDGLPRREAARPVEPEVVAPPSAAPRSRPTDPRLAPDAPATSARPTEPEPQREARRPSSPEAGVPSGGVEGVNPDSKRAVKPTPKPKVDAAAKPEKPVDGPAPGARTSPAAPAPSTAAKPLQTKPATATAEAGERKVRVIEGVTPMNSGQQASPAPQNNVEAAPKP
jgi:hypothetical protein